MKKILIIDDSLMDRKLLSSLLKKFGLENEVLQAGDGEEGFRVLGENASDIGLIFLDWQMPKISGLDFMRAFVKVPTFSTIPIIMITASGTDENKSEAYGVNPKLAGYLVKPFRPDKLIELTKSLLQ